MKGIAYQSAQQALDNLTDMTQDVSPIPQSEYLGRIEQAQRYMKQNQIDALYLNAGTNLQYFTGLQWYASERLVGAILPADGEVQFVVPFLKSAQLKTTG